MTSGGVNSLDGTDDVGSGRGGRTTRCLLAAATLAYFIAQGTLIPTVPRLLSEGIQAPSAVVGLVLATFSIASLLGRIPVARAHGSVVRLATSGGALVLLAAGLLAIATVASAAIAAALTLVALARVVAGLGDALFYPPVAIAFAAAPSAPATSMSRFTAVVYAGLLIGPAAGDAIWSRAGYQAAWLLAGVAAATAMALLVATTRSAPGRRRARAAHAHHVLEPTPSGERRRLIPAGTGLPAALAVLTTMPSAAFTTFAALYATHLGQSSAAVDLILYAAVVLLGRLGAARLLGRVDASATVAISSVVSVLACAVIMTATTPTGFAVGAAGLGAGQVASIPALYASALNRTPVRQHRAAMAVLTGCNDVALGAGAALFGLVLGLAGFTALFGVAAMSSIFALLASSMLRGEHHTAASDPYVPAHINHLGGNNDGRS